MIEYIVGHYAWFLGAIVLILLAVLGYYADKTNFGQKKIAKKNKNEESTEVEIKEEIVETPNLEETAEEAIENPQSLNIDSKTIEEQKEILEEKIEPVLEEVVEETIEDPVPSEIDKIEEAEDSFNKVSEQIDSLLPEKDVINIDLLEDIDELELGKTRKIDFNLVPDLDDIDLPKIKKLVDEEQDVWKF